MSVSTEIKSSILLVNYKTLELTAVCLNLIKKNLDLTKFEVWVVDNGSNDESVEYLRTLDWIHLLERVPESGENGFTAHGRALDMALECIKTDYAFLFHTDTFIYDAKILDTMLSKCEADSQVVAVGCLDQVYRTPFRTLWRIITRSIKHFYRKCKIFLGIKTRLPKEFREVYLKSFCALWNVKIVKELGMSFFMADRIPGYELQDKLTQLGYKTIAIPANFLFQYVDHVEAGTKALRKNYGKQNRRVKRQQSMLQNLYKDISN